MPVIRALKDEPEEPSLHDPDWRAFILAMEQTSELSSRDWKRFRSGVRQLKDEFRGRIPREAMNRELAWCVFDCACWYQPNVRIVRAALRSLLRHRLGVRSYVDVTFEYWKWAKAHSSEDLSIAHQMTALAQSALKRYDRTDRRTIEGMLREMVGAGED